MDIYQNTIHSNYSSLVQLYNPDSSCNQSYDDDNFWRDKILRQNGSDIINSKPDGMTWKEYYLSQYKNIPLYDEYQQHVTDLLVLKSSTIGELIFSGIQMLGLPLDGNYSVNFYIGQYRMYSSDLVDNWYNRFGNLGVLGYLHKDLNNSNNNLNDRTNIWSVMEQARIEIIQLTLRTQSKVRHSYIKLSLGRMLGYEHFHQRY